MMDAIIMRQYLVHFLETELNQYLSERKKKRSNKKTLVFTLIIIISSCAFHILLPLNIDPKISYDIHALVDKPKNLSNYSCGKSINCGTNK